MRRHGMKPPRLSEVLTCDREFQPHVCNSKRMSIRAVLSLWSCFFLSRGSFQSWGELDPVTYALKPSPQTLQIRTSRAQHHVSHVILPYTLLG